MGVDACKAGWIAVILRPDSRPEARFIGTVFDLDEAFPNAGTIAIDIPTRIPHRDPRPSELAAKAALGPRRHSIFITPPRKALMSQTYQEANDATKEITGKGLSRQSFALAAKILETEAWLNGRDGCPVIEASPELCFAEMTGGPMPDSKRTWSGLMGRVHALQRAGIHIDHIAGEAGGKAAPDDLVDAAAAAWTARRYILDLAARYPASGDDVIWA